MEVVIEVGDEVGDTTERETGLANGIIRWREVIVDLLSLCRCVSRPVTKEEHNSLAKI